MKFATLIVEHRRIVTVFDPSSANFYPVLGPNGKQVGDIVELIRKASTQHEVGKLPEGYFLSETAIAASSARIGAPLIPPRNIICVGKNYHEHAREFSDSGFDHSSGVGGDIIPKNPIVFTKVSTTVIGTKDDIRYPHGVSEKVDYEAELALVIGVGGRGIKKSEAYDHVFGYMIVNDVTARDLQAAHKQWFIGKSLDTFCPAGPLLVTSDEIDAENLEISCWVNGERRQNANTRDLIFDIPTLIETISAGITLVPGDVIATGTPAGVGIGLNPPQFLKPGDRVEIEISKLGRLTNQVK